MSEIDSYKHRCIGIVTCPASSEIVYGNTTTRKIPIYLLEEDALDATSFRGKKGDVLLGGGSGESAALRISLPEAFNYFCNIEANPLPQEFVKAYWTMNEAYVFCEGYAKQGWIPKVVIEYWLCQHVLSFLLKNYSGYKHFATKLEIIENGSICRLPEPEENWL